jgi:hypothetical protein
MNEALLSPGWTREVMITALRMAMSSGLLKKLVMITISHSLPAKVLQSTVLRILSFASLRHSYCRSSQESE